MIPNTSTVLGLISEDSLMFGLRLRIMGIESLIFLSEQLHRLRPIIESIFIQNQCISNIDFVSAFYTQCVDIAYGLRRPAYCGIAHFTINYDQVHLYSYPLESYLSISPEGESSFLWLKCTQLFECISMSQIPKINGVLVTIVIVENIDF